MCWQELGYSPPRRSARQALLDAFIGVWIDIVFLWRPNLPDESDNHLVELAVSGNAEWIITGNASDIATGELVFGGFRVVTPGAWLKEVD